MRDDLIVLMVGLYGLWAGSRLVVGNAVELARHFNVSDIFIGMTLLAFGTDLPELMVSIDGSIHNLKGVESSGVIIGNAIGSCIAQISIILGITAIFHYLAVGRRQLLHLTIELGGSAVLLFLLGYDGQLSRIDGGIMMTAFVVYLVTSFYQRGGAEKSVEGKAPKSPWSSAGLIAAGLLIVIFSSELTVDKALTLSQTWGIRQSFIGAVLIGLGTSLPELAISIGAIREGNSGLSLGNIMGSNIFDLLVPASVGALISELRFDERILWGDLPFLMIITIAVLWFLKRKRGLQRNEGVGLIVLYLAYVTVKLWIST